MADHQHKWHWRETIDDIDCASGMKCKCGATLSIDEVEDIVNAAVEAVEMIESWRRKLANINDLISTQL